MRGTPQAGGRGAAVLSALIFVAVPARAQTRGPAGVSSATAGITLRVDGQVDKPLTSQTRTSDGCRGGLWRQRITRAGSPFRGSRAHRRVEGRGRPLGDRLRGPHLAKFLVVEAADNYRAVFALPRRERGILAMSGLLLCTDPECAS